MGGGKLAVAVAALVAGLGVCRAQSGVLEGAASAAACAAGGSGCASASSAADAPAKFPPPAAWQALAEAAPRLDELGRVSDDTAALTRTFLSPAYFRAAALLRRWMEDAGLRTWVDDLGNVRGRLEGTEPSLPALLMGSHYDTVVDGGRFDGAMGVVVPIAAVKALRAAGHVPRRSIEIIGWCDEEGVRFGSTFLGSRAVSGRFPPAYLDAVDAKGITMAQALRQAGLNGTLESIRALAMPREAVHGYVEVHMEQGPVLEARGLPVGTVLGIAGQTRLRVELHGTQGHAGTVPMSQRRDALAGAAAMVSMLEERCKDGGGAPEEMLVCTVGALSLWPGASNVISGSVNFTVDIRARRDEVREPVVKDVTAWFEAECARRNLECLVDRHHDASAMASDVALTDKLRAAVRAAAEEGGAERRPDPAELGASEPVMVSGAGHDALAMSESFPTAMLFVRCLKGMSHTPLESVTKEDIERVARITMRYLELELL